MAYIGTALNPPQGGTGEANNSASTITVSGNHPATFTLTGSTSVTFPTSGTLAVAGGGAAPTIVTGAAGGSYQVLITDTTILLNISGTGQYTLNMMDTSTGYPAEGQVFLIKDIAGSMGTGAIGQVQLVITAPNGSPINGGDVFFDGYQFAYLSQPYGSIKFMFDNTIQPTYLIL